jgi:hypothetical protein
VINAASKKAIPSKALVGRCKRSIRDEIGWSRTVNAPSKSQLSPTSVKSAAIDRTQYVANRPLKGAGNKNWKLLFVGASLVSSSCLTGTGPAGDANSRLTEHGCFLSFGRRVDDVPGINRATDSILVDSRGRTLRTENTSNPFRFGDLEPNLAFQVPDREEKN